MASDTITTISPTTGKPILSRPGLTIAEIPALCENATIAFNSFANHSTLKQRQDIILKALDILQGQRYKLAGELTIQMGRPIAYAVKEITTAIARARYMLSISSEALAVTPGQEEYGFKREIHKYPVGPTLIIFAWNFPYLILINSLIPALLAGNSVILKPSPQTPTIAEDMQQIFTEAGLPPNVLQYFHCGVPTVIEEVIANPAIKLVCFTGSVAAGLQVQKAASDRIDLRVGLELGGNDAAYVRADVDVKWAAEDIVDGAIFNSGQSCCSVERVYVAAEIYSQFLAAVQQVLSGYILGNPGDRETQVGPVISKKAVETIQAHIKDALEKGAKDATPTNESFKNMPKQGTFVAPVILVDVTHDMLVMKEETFGPIIPIMKVHNDDEAIRLMNDSQLGLTGSIWTKDVAHGESLTKKVEAGTVFVNRCDYPSPDLAWTGWKDSGRGQTLSRFGFDQFIRLKSVHIKNYPDIKV